jgi:hypothetical protein
MALTEGDIYNLVGKQLREQGAKIAQLVRPGGQAVRSITFVENERRRTCYPDLLAMVGGEVVVGELKPLFSRADYYKLVSIAASEQACSQAFRIVTNGNRPENVGMKFVLCHSQQGAPPVDGVEQWIFAADGGLNIVQAG